MIEWMAVCRNCLYVSSAQEHRRGRVCYPECACPVSHSLCDGVGFGLRNDKVTRAKTQMHCVRVSYLFNTASMSSSTACNEYALLCAGCPCADTDAPLRTRELDGACLRFARGGDAGGLSAMVMGGVQFGIRDGVVGLVFERALSATSRHARPTISRRRALQLQGRLLGVDC